MYIDRSEGEREENNLVTLKEIDSNDESDAGSTYQIPIYLPRGQISYSPWLKYE